MVGCSFCGGFIEIGCEKIFVRKDGKIYSFCSNKCEKNQLKLKRLPQKVKWTNAYHKSKEIMKKVK